MFPDRFRLAFCLLDTLRRCTPSNIRKALDELPKTLDETYERVLQEIPEEKREHAHLLFQCLAIAIRPLRAEELAELFAIDFDRDGGPILKEGWRPESPEDAVLSACSTLIAVIEIRGSKIVQFSHLSVKEYLTSDRLRTSSMYRYHIPLVAAHTILAQACLTVLLQLDENVDEKRLKTFPLALYAAKHWVYHAKYEDVASQIQGAMEELFNPSKPYLATWIWIRDSAAYYQETFLYLEERSTEPEATALYYAAACGFSGVANYLIITHGENVHAKCGYRGSPLHAASYSGDLDVVRLLLAHGADINTTDRFKSTPLCSAYDGGHLDVMRLLLEHGADVDLGVDAFFMKGLLHLASERDDVDTARLLLQHNADVNARDIQGYTPLHHASRAGIAGTALLLLEHGADANARGVLGNTPLYLASKNGHLEVVQLLLRRSEETQALLGRLADLENLIRRLADAQIPPGHGVDAQIRPGHEANVHLRGDSDQTPFQVATLGGHVKIAQLLLEHGAEKE